MAWHQAGDNSSPELMMILFTDTYVISYQTNFKLREVDSDNKTRF